MAVVLGKEREGIWLLCLKEEEFNFPNKKHETERRTALTHYLGQITEKQMVGFCFESSIFCFDIVRL